MRHDPSLAESIHSLLVESMTQDVRTLCPHKPRTPHQCPCAAPHQHEPRNGAQLSSGKSATEEHKLTHRRHILRMKQTS